MNMRDNTPMFLSEMVSDTGFQDFFNKPTDTQAMKLFLDQVFNWWLVQQGIFTIDDVAFLPLQADDTISFLQRQTRNVPNPILGGRGYQMDAHYTTADYVYEVEMQQQLNNSRYDLNRIFAYADFLKWYQYMNIPEGQTKLRIKPVRQLCIFNFNYRNERPYLYLQGTNPNRQPGEIDILEDQFMQRVILQLPKFTKVLLIDLIGPHRELAEDMRQCILNNQIFDVQQNICQTKLDLWIYFIKNSQDLSWRQFRFINYHYQALGIEILRFNNYKKTKLDDFDQACFCGEK